MMTVKVQCECGQKFSFDVEPVNGVMPWTVACPSCGVDGTVAANQVIARQLATPAEAPSVVTPIRVSARQPVPVAATAPAAGAAPPPISPIRIPPKPPEAPRLAAEAPAPEPAPARPRSLSAYQAMQLGLVDHDQARIEARAKIMWGDSREEVIKYLMIQQFTAQEASDYVQELQKERASTVRKNGIRKLIIGSGLISIPIVTTIIMLSLGLIFVKILAFAVMAGLYGVWQFLNGLIMTVAPAREPGDVADQ